MDEKAEVLKDLEDRFASSFGRVDEAVLSLFEQGGLLGVSLEELEEVCLIANDRHRKAARERWADGRTRAGQDRVVDTER